MEAVSYKFMLMLSYLCIVNLSMVEHIHGGKLLKNTKYTG